MEPLRIAPVLEVTHEVVRRKDAGHAFRTISGLPVTVEGEIVGGIGLSSGTDCAQAALEQFYEKTGFKP